MLMIYIYIYIYICVVTEVNNGKESDCMEKNKVIQKREEFIMKEI